jgi:hypothetical protein
MSDDSSGSIPRSLEEGEVVLYRSNTTNDQEDQGPDVVYDTADMQDDDQFAPPWVKRLMELRVICRINSSLCMYLPAANGWMPLKSSVALRYIADITGGANASVN